MSSLSAYLDHVPREGFPLPSHPTLRFVGHVLALALKETGIPVATRLIMLVSSTCTAALYMQQVRGQTPWQIAAFRDPSDDGLFASSARMNQGYQNPGLGQQTLPVLVSKMSV